MADVIIIVGTRRGKERIPPAEIKQMSGRAGRKHGGEECKAYIISDEDSSDVMAGLENESGYVVESGLWQVESVAFHLLPEICSRRVKTIEDANVWYSRSLAYRQGNRVKMEKVIQHLVDSQSITNSFEPTSIGEISSSLYFHPLDVKAWSENFEEIFNSSLEKNDAAVAWALGNAPMSKVNGDFGDQRGIITQCRSSIPLGLFVNPGCMIKTTLWWCALGASSAGRMRNQMIALKNDIDRIVQALVRIDDDIAHWGKKEFFKELQWRVKRGITSGLMDLFKLDGMTKGMAQYLASVGVNTVEELRDSMNRLRNELDEEQYECLKRVAYGLR